MQIFGNLHSGRTGKRKTHLHVTDLFAHLVERARERRADIRLVIHIAFVDDCVMLIKRNDLNRL